MDDADTTNNTQNNAQNNVETRDNDDQSTAKKSFDYTPQNTNLCPDELETKLAQVSEQQKIRCVSTSSQGARSSDEEDDVPLTVEELAEKKKFDDKRKMHYNMKEQM